MDEMERTSARTRAKGDQMITALREHIEDIQRIGRTDPEQWSSRDRLVAAMCVVAVAGMVHEGRI